MLATASVVAALAVCFTGSWELTFLVFIAIPLLITSYRVGFSMYRGVQSADDSSLARASHVVTETTDNIKTVVSLGAEDYFVNSIKDNLRLQLRCECSNLVASVHLPLPSILRNGIRRSLLQAVAYAIPMAMVLCVYSAGWRFAAYLVIKERATIGGVFRHETMYDILITMYYYNP